MKLEKLIWLQTSGMVKPKLFPFIYINKQTFINSTIKQIIISALTCITTLVGAKQRT